MSPAGDLHYVGDGEVAMLDAVRDVVTRALESGEVCGAVVLVADDGAVVHADARGTADATSGHGLRRDTLFWLASMSKVVCAAAVLTLLDEGLVALDDPVSRFVPEFDPPGLVRVPAPGSPPALPQPPWAPAPDPMPRWDLVAAQREITLRDLLTHTSGLQSIFLYNADYHRPQLGDTLATHVPTLARVPRDFEAGTRWAYSNAAAFDVIARMAEVATGSPYDQIVRDRVVAPLGLSDLGFGLAQAPDAAPSNSRFSPDPVSEAAGGYYSAAAGMWGSMPAYLTFAELLRTGGLHRGRRLLAPSLVEMMTTNQVGDLCPGLNGRAETPGIGCGLGVAVVTDAAAAGTAVPSGGFGWDGVNSRRFWCSPDGWSLAMYVPNDEVQQRVEAAVSDALA